MVNIWLSQIDNMQSSIWYADYDSTEVAVGILAASLPILSAINENLDTEKYYFCNSDTDLSLYRPIKSFTRKQIKEYNKNFAKNYNTIIGDNEYGIWIKYNTSNLYSLYVFSSSDFFQGFLSFCSSYKRDFRHYIYGNHFDNKGNYYTLDDYLFNRRTVAMVDPDLRDIEILEAYDENTIVPLDKDY